MAAALIHSIGGSQFSASACKSGLWLSPGRLAAGGVRAAFKGWPPSEGAAPHRTRMPPEHSGAKRSLGAHPPRSGKALHLAAGRCLGSWQLSARKG